MAVKRYWSHNLFDFPFILQTSAHTAVFRLAYNRTGPFYVRIIWDPTLFTYKVHVK